MYPFILYMACGVMIFIKKISNFRFFFIFIFLKVVFYIITAP